MYKRQLQDNLRELADIQREKARLEAENLGGRVTYYDQGYSDIVESLDGYTRVSRTVLLVGLALWAVVLAAYCVLLPMQEGKTALLVTHDIAEAVSMSDRVVVLSARPAVVKTVLDMGALRGLPPLERRNTPEFHRYFDLIWKELDVHG